MGTRIVPVNDYSDGDATHRPTNPEWVPVLPPTIYLEKLAVGWLSYRGENINRSIKYRLDHLPDGYMLFEKPRKSGVAGAKMVSAHIALSRRICTHEHHADMIIEERQAPLRMWQSQVLRLAEPLPAAFHPRDE